MEKKVFRLLPLIFKLSESEFNNDLSNKVKSLIKLRNRLIHLRSTDIEPQKGQKSLWKQLFEQSK